MHENWPASIKYARVDGALSLSHTSTDGDVKALRGSNINTLLQMPDGTIYIGPGGGIATDGTSTTAVMAKNSWVHFTRELEQIVRKRLEADVGAAICAILGVASPPTDQLEFHFRIDSTGSMVVVEKTTNVAINFGPSSLREL